MSLALVPSPLRGEIDPGPCREAKEIRRGVVWLHHIVGKGDLKKVSKGHLIHVLQLLEYFSTYVNVASTSSTNVTSLHKLDH